MFTSSWVFKLLFNFWICFICIIIDLGNIMIRIYKKNHTYYRYVGICTAIKIISAAIFVFDWLLIRWKYKLDMEGTMTVGDIVNSLMSVDKDHEQDNLAEESVWLPELQGSQTPAGHQANTNTSTAAASSHYQHRRNGSLINRQQMPSHSSGNSYLHLQLIIFRNLIPCHQSLPEV